MPVTPGGEVTDPKDLPKVHQETRLALEFMTDHAAFQNLCDMVLSEKWGYKIHPRGVSAHGTVRGQPDSWGEDREGRATAFCYGTNKDWRRKLWEDLAEVAAQEEDGVKPDIVVFGTNRHIDADVERDLRQEVREKYGWELHLFGQGELAIALDTELQHLRRQFLNIALERHTWRSLLAACADQREGVLARYAGKYDPSLYVPRCAEAIVATAFRDAVTAIARGKPHAQFVPLVDQAGAGKSTLMLRLAEMYGARGPVVILPGSQRLVDEHSFERELVNAVGYPQDGRTYQANLHELCDIARRAGFPLMVILEAVNEGRDLALARSAVLQLLIAHRDSSLLVVMTCRDSVWHHLRNHTLRTFVPSNILPSGSSTEFAVPVGQYDDEESRAALDCYFARWRITGHVGGNAARLLRLPLLLSIFAEVYQGRNIGHLRALSSSELWRKYEARKIDDVYEALERSLRKSAIAGTIEQIAQVMLERGTPVLEVSDVSDVPHLDPQSESPESLFVQLKNAGILLEDPPETIRFAHEPFAEFVLGRILAEQLDRAEQRIAALDGAEQLVCGERWRHVVIHAATLVKDPDPLLTRLRSANLWWATRVLLALDGLTPTDVRAEIVRDLGDQLTSPYALDRRRAADALGRLGATESVDQLRVNWDSSHDAAALRALARLGVEDIAEELVLNLGRAHRFYWPELQEFVDSLCKPFKDCALQEAIRLLGKPDHAQAAATALGYSRDDRAVGPLTTYLESVNWADADALLALLRIGSQEALAALERAIAALGESISHAAETQTHESGTTGTPQKQESAHSGHPDGYWALETLRVYGLQHTPTELATPLLKRLLEHPNFYVRYEAISALTWLGAAEVAPALVMSASRAASEWSIGFQVTQAIKAFGRRIDARAFVDLANDPATPDSVMPHVLAALGASGDRRALPVLRRFVSERRFLSAAIEALGELGDPAAIEILAPLLEAADTGDVSADAVHDWVVVPLGRLQHPAAFGPLERRYWVERGPIELEALVATGREQAIPILREAWSQEGTNSLTRQTILQALIWIDSTEAANAIHDLLAPPDEVKVGLLAAAIFHGRGLPFITGTVMGGPVDDSLVDLIDDWFDRLPPDDQQKAVWGLGSAQTPRALAVLERIATEPQYDRPTPWAKPDESRTMRDEALRLLADAGSLAALDFAADHVGESGAALLEESLVRMDRRPVLDALRHRLAGAPEAKLVRLLELLGWLGDQMVLDDVRRYFADARQSVADAAYEAEQRILGLAD